MNAGVDSPGGKTVSARGLEKSFGDFKAVDGVDLSVGCGEFFGLLGPNGAGKSTTIKMLTGLSRPDCGSVSICGFDLEEHPLDAKRRIGLLQEEPALFERLTGAEFIHFTARLYGLSDSEARGRASELFGLLDLEAKKDDLVLDYSFGMKKKLGLVAALIHDPDVIFLDEPFNGIDVVSMYAVRRVLEDLIGRGKTIFFSSHVMEVVEKLCSRIAIMNKGRILVTGTIEELEHLASNENGDINGLEDVFLYFIGHPPASGRLSWMS